MRRWTRSLDAECAGTWKLLWQRSSRRMTFNLEPADLPQSTGIRRCLNTDIAVCEPAVTHQPCGRPGATGILPLGTEPLSKARALKIRPE